MMAKVRHGEILFAWIIALLLFLWALSYVDFNNLELEHLLKHQYDAAWRFVSAILFAILGLYLFLNR
jgi:hypothetical protein